MKAMSEPIKYLEYNVRDSGYLVKKTTWPRRYMPLHTGNGSDMLSVTVYLSEWLTNTKQNIKKLLCSVNRRDDQQSKIEIQ